jgi:hypothetical protein
LSLLSAQTAGLTGTNWITQTVFSTCGRSDFAGQVNGAASTLTTGLNFGVHLTARSWKSCNLSSVYQP